MQKSRQMISAKSLRTRDCPVLNCFLQSVPIPCPDYQDKGHTNIAYQGPLQLIVKSKNHRLTISMFTSSCQLLCLFVSHVMFMVCLSDVVGNCAHFALPKKKTSSQPVHQPKDGPQKKHAGLQGLGQKCVV